MNPKTKIRSEVYRLFNPYHDELGRFAAKAGGAIRGGFKKGIEKRKKVGETVAKTTAAYHAVTSAKRLYKAPVGKAVRKRVKKIAEWANDNPETAALMVKAAVAIAVDIAIGRVVKTYREESLRKTFGSGLYGRMREAGVKFQGVDY